MWFSRYFKKTKVGLFGPIEEYAGFLRQHTGFLRWQSADHTSTHNSYGQSAPTPFLDLELDLDKLLDDVGKGDEDHEDDDEGVHGEGGEDEGAPRNGVLCASDLEANVSYVIVDYEGSFFPGMVTEIKDANVKVSCMVPALSKMRKTFWKWPEIEDTCWYTIDKMIEKIQTPVLVGNRGKYQVDEAEKFW